MAKHALANVEGFVKRGGEIFQVDPKVLIADTSRNIREAYGEDEDDQSLKEWIRENGSLQLPPLDVQKQANNTLLVRDGYRRNWAMKELINEGVDLRSVYVRLVDKDMSDEEALFLAISRGQGKRPSHVEEARAFVRLKNYGHTVDEIAKRIGKSKVFVYERLKLVNMTYETRQALENKEITIHDAAKIADSSGGNSDRQKDGVEQAKKRLSTTKKFNRLKELVKTYIECIDAIIADYHNPWPGDLAEISDTANQAKAEIQALLE